MHYALISFLNARPLWWGLVHGDPIAAETWEFTSPARCADLLAAGEADLGLIPAIEMARVPGLVAVPGICIASRAEVRSVLLLSRVPFDAIRSVALDPNSRTSVALARILLGETLGEARYRAIRFNPVESRHLRSFEGHDAAVVIGDPALQATRGGFEAGGTLHRYDLVSEWQALFGEPFVFAVWGGRRDRLERYPGAEIIRRLESSRSYGLARTEAIAREAAEELGLPLGELIDYFHHALHYAMGEEESRGLARFLDLAARYSLIEESREIEWLENPKVTGSPRS